MNVTAILVTRGNVPLGDILDSIPSEWEILIWDNDTGGTEPCLRRVAGYNIPHETYLFEESEPATDLHVYGRYAAIEFAKGDVIYVQDDDAVCPAEKILERYEPGRLVANMPESRWRGYPDSVMVGWGAVFDRDLPGQAFEKYADYWNGAFVDVRKEPKPDVFRRTSDIVFSMLVPRTVIDVGFRHLPWAEGPGRMWTSDKNHGAERNAMIDLCRRVRTWSDDDRRIPA